MSLGMTIIIGDLILIVWMMFGTAGVVLATASDDSFKDYSELPLFWVVLISLASALGPILLLAYFFFKYRDSK